MNEFGAWIAGIAAEAFRAVGVVLRGPFGGIAGGAVSFLLLDLGWKRQRERHQVAEVLAAELAINADQIEALLTVCGTELEVHSLRYSRVVFGAVASRLGSLDFPDVASVTQVY